MSRRDLEFRAKHGVSSYDIVRAGRDRWLVSYVDLVTLLLACFATAYGAAYAKTTPADLSAGASAKAEETAGREGGPVPPAEPVTPVTPVTPAVSLRDLVEPVVIVAGSRLDLIEDTRGLVVSLPESASFPTGSAVLTNEAKTFLRRLADVVGPTSASLRIEGHTDNIPLTGGRYGTNWELSTARASAVVLFLISEASFVPQRLSAAGFGEFHPRASNDTPEDRALNRRVDVVIMAADREAAR